MADQTFKTRYMFSVQTDLVSYKLGETPQGFRIDVDYANGKVVTDSDTWFDSWAEDLPHMIRKASKSARDEWLAKMRHCSSRDERKRVQFDGKDVAPDLKADWFGLSGTIISGADWLLVRRDGVMEIDGRLTIQEEIWDANKDGGGGALINTRVSTLVDLAKTGVTGERSAVYERWKAGDAPEEIQFPMAIRFDAAEATQPWALDEYRSLGGFWRTATLPLFQYAANVKARMANGLIQNLSWDVWRIHFAQDVLSFRSSS